MLSNEELQSFKNNDTARALAELELRRRRVNTNFDFESWLNKTSPQYTWSYPHLKEIRKHLTEYENGKYINLLILMPPQHGKTTHTTNHFPAYLLDKYKTKRIMVIGHTSTFVRDNFSMPTRRILEPKGILRISRSDLIVHNDGGFIKYFSFESGVTGTPTDLIMIDDPYHNYEQASSQQQRNKILQEYIWGVMSRKRDSELSKVSKIVIMTPWHYDDLAHYLMKQKDSFGNYIWSVIKLPAFAKENDILGRKEGEPLCPELQSKESLIETRFENPEMFNAMYQLSPEMDGGNIVKREWFNNRYDLKEILRLNYVIISFDTAWKTAERNDYTVGVAWGIRDKNIYILDVWRDKIPSTELGSVILSFSKKWEEFGIVQAVVIEETPNSEPIIRQLQNTSTYNIIGVLPRGEKVVRLKAVCGMIQNGRVFLPKLSTWELDYIDELIAFPKGKHDDQVDATSLGLGYIHGEDSNNFWDNLCE